MHQAAKFRHFPHSSNFAPKDTYKKSPIGQRKSVVKEYIKTQSTGMLEIPIRVFKKKIHIKKIVYITN